DELADFAVIPAGNGVEAAVADFAHGAVAVVVEDEDDGAQAQAHGGGELGAGHLECAVAHQDDGAQLRVGDGDANGCGDGEAHRQVVGGGDELGALAGADADRAKEAVADVGDHAAVFVEVQGDD